MRNVLCLSMVLLAAVTAVVGQVSDPAPAEAPAADPNPNPAEDREILEILRILASGEPSLDTTKDASFSLAEALIRIEGWKHPETRQVAESIAASYVEDPRTAGLLLRLIDLDLEDGDRYGSHMLYRYLNRPEFIRENPEIAVRAILNAVEIVDYSAAFNWSRSLDRDLLQEKSWTDVTVAILHAAHGVKRLDVALEATRELEKRSPERLRVSETAFLAAADTYEQMGLLDDAARTYEAFFNIHSASPSTPAAMLTLARLAMRREDIDWAQRLYERLEEIAPASPEAYSARIDLLELEPGPVTADRLPEYLDIALTAPEDFESRAAFDRILERFIGAGYPLEAVSALAAVGRADDGTLVPLAARRSLSEALEAAIALLASRNDAIGIAAVAAEALSAQVPIPASQMEILRNARRSLGLDPNLPDRFAEKLDAARHHSQEGSWEKTGQALERALSSEAARGHQRRLEAQVLLAEALWRTRHEAEALVRIQESYRMAGSPDERRELHVLRADILFSVGRIGDSCDLYHEAASIAESPWVMSQIDHCAGHLETAGKVASPATEKEG